MTHRYDLVVHAQYESGQPVPHKLSNVSARDFNQAYQIAVMYAVLREPGAVCFEIVKCDRVSEEGEGRVHVW